MTIAALDVSQYRLPLDPPLTDATHGAMSVFEVIIVDIRTDDGATGSGYTYTAGRAGGAVRSLIEDDFRPLLIGADAGRIEALWQRLWHAVHYTGRGGPVSFALAAVDVALWDLKARRAGLPLWRLLGGHDPEVACYAGGIDLQDPIADLLARTERRVEDGFRAIKMKVGRADVHEDVARVGAMRQLLGDGFPLMVDANMGWRAGAAVHAARLLRPFGLVWLEEPVAPDDFPAHRRVRDVGIPIAAGENLHTLAEFQALLAAGGADFPEPDLATCGGITVWRKVAALAEAHGLPVTSHGVHDLHVHVLAAAPNASYLEIHGFGLDAFIVHPLELRGGKAVAPDRAGHGVEFDRERLRACAI